MRVPAGDGGCPPRFVGATASATPVNQEPKRREPKRRATNDGGKRESRCGQHLKPVALRWRGAMTACIITRIQTGDYDRWRPMFDQDKPRAREKAHVQRVLRSIDDPNEVFIYLEYVSAEDAKEARERLITSGVLERFEDTHGPTVLVDAG
jgi:hypothetical protein